MSGGGGAYAKEHEEGLFLGEEVEEGVHQKVHALHVPDLGVVKIDRCLRIRRGQWDDEETKHLTILRCGDVHATEIRFDHGERRGGDAELLAPDDGVVAHLVALLHTQELRPQKAPDFLGNGIAKELKHWGLDSLG